jgi:hypothetical protein
MSITYIHQPPPALRIIRARSGFIPDGTAGTAAVYDGVWKPAWGVLDDGGGAPKGTGGGAPQPPEVAVPPP